MTRRGYTLFELVLVTALIIAAASLTVPVVESLLAPNRVYAAGDMIRAHLVEMRSRAMSESRPYRFLFMENTGKFKIEPEEELDAAPSDDGAVIEGELPEDVFFVKDPGSLIGLTAPPNASSSWEHVLSYLPEGNTRRDIVLYFGTAGTRASGFQIRSLTGAIAPVDFSQPVTEEWP